jgi:hypothetical protein
MIPGSNRQSCWVLTLYGLYALALGVVDYVRGGFMVFASATPTEIDFAGHLLQSHSCSLIGLGCAALCLRRASGDLRPVYICLLLSNALGAYVELPAAMRGMGSLSLGVSQAVWGVCFLWLAFGSVVSDQEILRHEPRVHAPGVMDRVTAFSFFGFVLLTGLLWVFAAPKIAIAAAGSLAGPTAIFAGQARGPADVALAALGWLTGTRRELTQVRCLASSLFFANLVLLSVGLQAQVSALSTPGRWSVFTLHVLWTIGFFFMRRRLPPPAA